MPMDDTWLALNQEAVLEPQRPICDPHHHLWDHPGSRYLLDELLADITSGHNVVSTVFVECASMYRAAGPEALRPVGETEFAGGIAAMSASGNHGSARICAGIVGFADLTLGSAVREVLEAHIAAAPDRFRGIRHAAAWHPSGEIRNSHTNPVEGLFCDSRFREGFAVLGELGLSFDAWLYHTQIPELIDLARAFPDTVIIVDHFAGPLGIGPYAGRLDEVFADWRRAIAPLAECRNVYAKLGGLGMARCGYGWHTREAPPSSSTLADATRRYHDAMIELLGPERCMFESNFPVDKVSCSYRTLWNAFKRIAAGYSEGEKAALFHDTAVRAYRL